MQSVQRRLGKMRGERHGNEERAQQEAKIIQLTAELEQKRAVHGHLNDQIKRVNVSHVYISFIHTYTLCA